MMFKGLKRVSETATTQQQSSRLFEKLQGNIAKTARQYSMLLDYL
ncbi:MAG: hypothetical protein ACJ71K_18320 [Nitrososphaeraceae archaeon]